MPMFGWVAPLSVVDLHKMGNHQKPYKSHARKFEVLNQIVNP
jgi:hypothetical protein